MPVLTGIDVLGVQRFVFSSNRLRDVVTGSFLVHWSTAFNGALNCSGSAGRILFAGGGNAIIEFRYLTEARSFAACYTRILYDHAPGLEVTIAHKEFENGNLAKTLQELQIDLARKKIARLPSVPLLGISVTVPCMETGLPATGFDSTDPTVPVSRYILKRRERKDDANSHWKAFLKERENYAFPLELDHLGRTVGDTSMIGIVHVDGNGVGEKINKWLKEKVNDGVDDDSVSREYQEWSKSLDQLGRDALHAVVDRTCSRIDVSSDKQTAKVTGIPAGLSIELSSLSGRFMLPLRPVLLGGDDLTFICDGRIALDLARTALCVFERSNIPHLGKISASAGIAIVRVRSPFARAYELAEKLCGSAKRMLKETSDSGCALDWHIGLAGPSETVADIRERQYMARNRYKLTCRPIRLGSGTDDSETWHWLYGKLLDDRIFGLRGEVWSERKNKVKKLAELVREGPDELKRAIASWRVVDKNLNLPQPIESDGFFAKSRTPLLDAVELVDIHLVLEKPGDMQVKEGLMP
jgi:hypothetical protein